MDIIFTIGKEDPFKENNEHLSQILWQKELNTNYIFGMTEHIVATIGGEWLLCIFKNNSQFPRSFFDFDSNHLL